MLLLLCIITFVSRVLLFSSLHHILDLPSITLHALLHSVLTSHLARNGNLDQNPFAFHRAALRDRRGFHDLNRIPNPIAPPNPNVALKLNPNPNPFAAAPRRHRFHEPLRAGVEERRPLPEFEEREREVQEVRNRIAGRYREASAQLNRGDLANAVLERNRGVGRIRDGAPEREGGYDVLAESLDRFERRGQAVIGAMRPERNAPVPLGGSELAERTRGARGARAQFDRLAKERRVAGLDVQAPLPIFINNKFANIGINVGAGQRDNDGDDDDVPRMQRMRDPFEDYVNFVLPEMPGFEDWMRGEGNENPFAPAPRGGNGDGIRSANTNANEKERPQDAAARRQGHLRVEAEGSEVVPVHAPGPTPARGEARERRMIRASRRTLPGVQPTDDGDGERNGDPAPELEPKIILRGRPIPRLLNKHSGRRPPPDAGVGAGGAHRDETVARDADLRHQVDQLLELEINQPIRVDDVFPRRHRDAAHMFPGIAEEAKRNRNQDQSQILDRDRAATIADAWRVASAEIAEWRNENPVDDADAWDRRDQDQEQYQNQRAPHWNPGDFNFAEFFVAEEDAPAGAGVAPGYRIGMPPRPPPISNAGGKNAMKRRLGDGLGGLDGGSGGGEREGDALA
jgi:hypothetical protein